MFFYKVKGHLQDLSSLERVKKYGLKSHLHYLFRHPSISLLYLDITYLCYSQCIFIECPYFQELKEMDHYSCQTNQPENKSYDETYNYGRLHTAKQNT